MSYERRVYPEFLLGSSCTMTFGYDSTDLGVSWLNYDSLLL